MRGGCRASGRGGRGAGSGAGSTAHRAAGSNVDAKEPVFLEGALLYLGPAGPPLVEAFDRIYHSALEADSYKTTVPEGALYRAEVRAMAKDLAALAGRAERLARQGPLDSESARQIKATALMVDIARDLDRHRTKLEDLYD